MDEDEAEDEDEMNPKTQGDSRSEVNGIFDF